MAKTHPQSRTSRRIARLRVDNPKALSGIKADNRYTPRERRQVRAAVHELNAKQKAKRSKPKRPEPYNPLAPLTGDRAVQEENAAADLRFGGQEDELRRAAAAQQQTTANTGSYFDEYKKALSDAADRVRADNAALAQGMQQRTDTAYAQDKAAAAARGATPEGMQAVEAARSQGNQAAATAGSKGVSDNKYFEDRAATSVLAKAQALARENAKSSQIGEEQKKLAQQKGEFKVDYRAKQRESERSYALASKEFGLKEAELSQKTADNRAERSVERSKTAAQKLIAKMYADANKAKARATIRVAQIQLKKGKIDQKQYRTIRNIYEGLPGSGKSGGSAGLQNWEKDKVDLAVRSLRSAQAKPNEKAAMIDRLVKRGDIPARLARIAWRRYVSSATGYSKGGGAD